MYFEEQKELSIIQILIRSWRVFRRNALLFTVAGLVPYLFNEPVRMMMHNGSLKHFLKQFSFTLVNIFAWFTYSMTFHIAELLFYLIVVYLVYH